MKDDAVLAEALAMVDKYVFENPEKSHFSNHTQESFIKCYLQLFWNPEENSIYEDINLFAAAAKGVMPLRKRIGFVLYDDSEVSLTSSAWGWWARMANRLDYGRFKTVLRKKYGKDNDFAHYFHIRN